MVPEPCRTPTSVPQGRTERSRRSLARPDYAILMPISLVLYQLDRISPIIFISIDMLIIKPKQQQFTWMMFLLLGLGYFSAMSHLEINYFLKSLIVIMPIQVVAIIYVTYLRWSRQPPVGEFKIQNSKFKIKNPTDKSGNLER
ncbi:hypothetical protein [Nostoc sp.]|uniref:hypothetical protein n=1 Tax=Nostoc sp. TaxID=1180 RepID=UPI002FF4F812